MKTHDSFRRFDVSPRVQECARVANRVVVASLAVLAVCASATGCRTAMPAAEPRPAGDAQVRVALAHDLPPLDGRHVKVTVLEVTFGPGGSSHPHSHPCAVIGYIVSGSFRSQVDGGAVETFVAGQSFYEAPNGVHRISANASTTESVTFIATFVCDREVPLSAPVATPPV